MFNALACPLLQRVILRLFDTFGILEGVEFN